MARGISSDLKISVIYCELEKGFVQPKVQETAYHRTNQTMWENKFASFTNLPKKLYQQTNYRAFLVSKDEQKKTHKLLILLPATSLLLDLLFSTHIRESSSQMNCSARFLKPDSHSRSWRREMPRWENLKWNKKMVSEQKHDFSPQKKNVLSKPEPFMRISLNNLLQP